MVNSSGLPARRVILASNPVGKEELISSVVCRSVVSICSLKVKDDVVVIEIDSWVRVQDEVR
jgi:hypothetical protein